MELLHQESPAYLEGMPQVLPLQNGDFAASTISGGQNVLVAVFDSSGTFVREIGKVGEGPMEFNGPPRPAMPMEEGFLAHDPVLRRVSFLSHDGRVEWQEKLDAISFQMIGSGDNLVLSGLSVVDDAIFGIGMFTQEGEHIRSLLPMEQTGRVPNFPMLSGTEDGDFWAMPREGGTLTHFSGQGEVLAEYPMSLQVAPDGFNMPVVGGIQAQDGLVWILQWLPIDDDLDPSVTGQTPEWIHTKFSAFDPAAGEIVAVEWIQGMLQPMGYRQFSLTVFDELGDTRIWVGPVILDPSR